MSTNMGLNTVNLNSMIPLLGDLSTNRAESKQEESIFPSLMKKEGIEDLLEENGLNLDEIESPIEVLLLILSLILGIGLNNKESKGQDSGVQLTSSPKTSSAKKTTSTEKTDNTEKTSEEKSTDKVSAENTDSTEDADDLIDPGLLIKEGKDHVYEVSSASAVEKFREENPELFDESLSSEEYNAAFDKLAEKGEVVKHTLRTSANDKNNIKKVDTTEKTVIDMGDGIFLYKGQTTFLDGDVLNNRSVNIGLDYTDIQYDDNGAISKVTRGKEAKENGGSVSITSISNNISGDRDIFDGSSSTATKKDKNGEIISTDSFSLEGKEGPFDHSDHAIESLKRRGYV